MSPSALFDHLRTHLSARPELSGWTILAHTAQVPANRQIDMTLEGADVGAVTQGVDWMSETVVLRLAIATAMHGSIAESHRSLLNLRDPVSRAVLEAFSSAPGSVLLYPDNRGPRWDELGVTTAGGTDNTPFLVLELRVPFERRMI